MWAFLRMLLLPLLLHAFLHMLRRTWRLHTWFLRMRHLWLWCGAELLCLRVLRLLLHLLHLLMHLRLSLHLWRSRLIVGTRFWTCLLPEFFMSLLDAAVLHITGTQAGRCTVFCALLSTVRHVLWSSRAG